jgi:hypothetical protein
VGGWKSSLAAGNEVANGFPRAPVSNDELPTECIADLEAAAARVGDAVGAGHESDSSSSASEVEAEGFAEYWPEPLESYW